MTRTGLYMFFCLMALSACDLVQLERKNFVATGTTDSLDYTNATITGTLRDVSNRNGSRVKQHGHCWDTVINPMVEEGKQFTELGEKRKAGNYTSSLTPLQPGATYFVRGYTYDNENGFIYGENYKFTVPRVTTFIVIVKDTSAQAIGKLDLVPTNPVIEHGHCWSINENPTIADSVTALGAKSDSLDFISNIGYLNRETEYNVRTYIITQKDTLYGQNGLFTTLPKK
ncbi:hypothetical protein [uncultured Microscilla sp.]|uniref:hypothetical protein n=1 Tax=uncultured Microscilla sp. TaxID=432653 RepID=UPI002636060E|nr:hypothetical protein [uncultured Microscilla sp.]